MGFQDIDLSGIDDAQERVSLVPGEYQLRLNKIEIKESKEKKEPYLNLGFSVEGEPTARRLYHTLFLPKAADDAARKNDTKFALKNFCDANDIAVATFANALTIGLQDPSTNAFVQFEGSLSWAILGEKTYNNVVSNSIISFTKKR